MKKYTDFLFELKKLEPKNSKVKNSNHTIPILILKKDDVEMPVLNDVLFMSIDEIKRDYKINRIEITNLNIDSIIEVLTINFNNMKIMYDTEYEFNTLYFENNEQKLAQIEISFNDKRFIIVKIFDKELRIDNTISDEIYDILDKYLARDGKKFITNLYFDSIIEENPIAESKPLMKLFRGYEVQKFLFDKGQLNILSKVGFNDKLLSEHPDIKKQNEWS